MQSQSRQPWWRDGAAWIGALAVVVVFSGACRHGFLGLDDTDNIVANPYAGKPFGEMLARMWSAPFIGLYVPVTYSFWGLLWRLAGGPEAQTLAALDRVGMLMHAANVVLHAVNAGLVYQLLRRGGGGRAAAAIGSLLFALHPLQAEPVAWITGSKDLLSGTFALTALLLVAPWTGAAPPGRLGWARCAAASLAFLAAVFAKPSAVVLPLVVAALIVIGGRRPAPRRLRVTAGLWLAAGLVVAVVTAAAHPVGEQAAVASPWQRLLVAGDAGAFYLGKLVFPWRLAIDYGRTPAAVLASPWVWATAAVPAGVALALWRFRRRQAPLGRAFAVFCLFLLPNAGLVSFYFQIHSTVADRYAYLALVGAAMAAAALVPRPSRRQLAVAAAVILALAGRTWLQVATWKDDLTLARAAFAVNPESRLALENVGNYGVLAVEKKQPELAEAMLAEAAKAFPRSATAAFNLCTVVSSAGRHAEAMRYCEEAARLDPAWEMPLVNLGTLYGDAHRDADAERTFRKAVALDRDSYLGWLNLASFYTAMARPQEAVECWLEVARLKPDDVEPRAQLARFFTQLGAAAPAAEAQRELARVQASAPHDTMAP